MNVSQAVRCVDFPCQDIEPARYVVPDIDIDPERVRLVMISETAPADAADWYYARGESLFAQTTVLAFQDAGVAVQSLDDVLDRGVYITPAVKCAKKGYTIKAATVRNCSQLLEQEIALFPNVAVYLLMGDVAIRAMNYVTKRQTGQRVIPAGSTYKIRGGEYTYGQARAYPSYLQAGKSFFIEKSKRRMIAEDIASAMALMD